MIQELLDVKVLVSNIGAGHMIPTGIPGIREMWLEVSVLNGSQVATTQKRPLVLELFDENGKPAMPWDAVRFGKDTRIGPKKTRVEQFAFKVTNSADMRVEAKLLERLVSEQAARYAGVQPSPPMSMAEASASALPGHDGEWSAAPRTAPPRSSRASPWWRWRLR